VEELGLILSAIILCSLSTALLTQLLGRLRVNRNIRLETLLLEQKEWRERINKLVVNSRHAFDQRDASLFNRITAELRVRLDPDDPEDAKILNLCKEVALDWDEQKLEEIHDRISYWLKYDLDQTRRELSSSLFYRYLFVLLVTFYATIYLYLEGMLGIDPTVANSIGTVHLVMGGAILVVSLWLVLSFLSRLDSRILAMLLGNAVRRRYKKKRAKRTPVIKINPKDSRERVGSPKEWRKGA